MPTRGKLSAAVFAVVGAMVLLGTQTPANAETSGLGWVEQVTATGYCEAGVVPENNGSSSVRAVFWNYQAGWSCSGWLDRSMDGGSYWYTISGYHTVDSTTGTRSFDATGYYWDGPGYLARACFRLNFAGATTHCTGGVTASQLW